MTSLPVWSNLFVSFGRTIPYIKILRNKLCLGWIHYAVVMVTGLDWTKFVEDEKKKRIAENLLLQKLSWYIMVHIELIMTQRIREKLNHISLIFSCGVTFITNICPILACSLSLSG